MVAYHYWLGPPRLVADEMGDYWAPPPGTVGWVDVAPLPGQGQSADRQARGCGFYAVSGDPLPSDEYDLLASGDLREIAMTGGIASTWDGCTGYRPPVAGTLLDALWEHLTDGSAPDGSSGPMPLMPTTRGALDLHLGGHSLVRRERFALVGPRAHRHAPRVLESLHRQYEAIERDEQRGRARPGHALRVADYWRAKYRLGAREDERESAAWRVLLPGRARGRVRRLIPHETTYTDDFNRASLGAGWSLVDGVGWTITANELDTGTAQGSNFPSSLRLESDLSSSDHYAQITCTATGASTRFLTPAVRFSSSTETFYFPLQRASSTVRLYKAVSGVGTQIAEYGAGTGPPVVNKIQADGSTISTYVDGDLEGETTDTAIAGGVRCGACGHSTNPDAQGDDFEAADLVVPSALQQMLLMHG